MNPLPPPNKGATVLSLQNQQYTGTIPTEYSTMTKLTVFDVSENQLTGAVPTQLGSLTKLSGGSPLAAHKGMLSSNRLEGSLPTELGMCTKLVDFFYLDSNSFSSTLPSQLGNFKKLVNVFNLENNRLTGSVPSQLGKMTKLNFDLSLNRNALHGTVPTELFCMTLMSVGVRLNDNSLEGCIPSQIGKLSLMSTVLHLSTNRFTSSLPTEVGMLSSHTSLFSVHENRISHPLPTEIGALSRMVMGLQASDNSFTGQTPTQLGNMVSMISHLQLFSNKLSGSMPTELGRLSGLVKTLELESNKIAGAVPTQIGRLSQLRLLLRLGGANSLSSTIPTEVGNLIRFSSVFNIASNRLTGTIPTELGRMSAMLNGLYCKVNSLSGSLPTELGAYSTMTENFQLQSNKLCGELPTEVAVLSVGFHDFKFSANSIGSHCVSGGQNNGTNSTHHEFHHHDGGSGAPAIAMAAVAVVVVVVGVLSALLMARTALRKKRYSRHGWQGLSDGEEAGGDDLEPVFLANEAPNGAIHRSLKGPTDEPNDALDALFGDDASSDGTDAFLYSKSAGFEMALLPLSAHSDALSERSASGTRAGAASSWLMHRGVNSVSNGSNPGDGASDDEEKKNTSAFSSADSLTWGMAKSDASESAASSAKRQALAGWLGLSDLSAAQLPGDHFMYMDMLRESPSPTFIVDTQLRILLWSQGMLEATSIQLEVGDYLSSLPYASANNRAKVMTTLAEIKAAGGAPGSSTTILMHLQPKNTNDVLLSFNVRTFDEGSTPTDGIRRRHIVAMGRKVDAKLSGLYSAGSVDDDGISSVTSVTYDTVSASTPSEMGDGSLEQQIPPQRISHEVRQSLVIDRRASPYGLEEHSLPADVMAGPSDTLQHSPPHSGVGDSGTGDAAKSSGDQHHDDHENLSNSYEVSVRSGTISGGSVRSDGLQMAYSYLRTMENKVPRDFATVGDEFHGDWGAPEERHREDEQSGAEDTGQSAV